MPVTHHFSGLGSAVSLVHVACVFVRPDNNFKLNDRLSRYVARWFTLILSRSNSQLNVIGQFTPRSPKENKSWTTGEDRGVADGDWKEDLNWKL